MPEVNYNSKLLVYSKDGKSVFVNDRNYDLDDDVSLSLTACPQFVEEAMEQWKD